MTVSVRYTGTLNPYFELAVTGKPTKWTPGRTGDVSDVDAALLIATGFFEVYADRVLPFAFDEAGDIAGVRMPDGTVAPVGTGGAYGIFRGPYAWAARPVTGLTVGDTFRASDVGTSPGTMFMWTGARWRRLHRFLLARNVGSVAAPVATLGTGITEGTFTIPNPLATFADLLEAGDSLVIRALITRAGTGGTNNVTVYLGTAGTTGDSLVRNESLTAVDNRTINIVTQVYFSSTTNFISNAATEENGVTTLLVVDRTTNVNLAAAMTVTIAIAAANVADSWKLLACSLEVL